MSSVSLKYALSRDNASARRLSRWGVRAWSSDASGLERDYAIVTRRFGEGSDLDAAKWCRYIARSVIADRCRFTRLARTTATLLAIAVSMGMPGEIAACPFCARVTNRLTDDLREASVAVLAKCVQRASTSAADAQRRIAIHQFRVVEVIKEQTQQIGGVTLGPTLETFSNNDIRPGQLCLIVGYADAQLQWGAPIEVTLAAADYLRGLAKLAADNPQRLAYFLPFLDHADKLIADDAHNEFAMASLANVSALRERLDRASILRQLRASDVPVHRRRLYWTLLGICGREVDTKFVEETIRRAQVHGKLIRDLNAALGCYLTVGGERALEAIEEKYLGNPNAKYTDTYAAIVAVRVHGMELMQFPKARLASALRLVLDRPPLADLVIPDLARWEDWSVIDRMVDLFVEAQPDIRFIRVPIVRYLLACPLPEASVAIQRLREVDPQAIARAEKLIALPGDDLAGGSERGPSTLIQPAVPQASTPNHGPQGVSGRGDMLAERPTAVSSWKGRFFIVAAGVAVAVLLTWCSLIRRS